MSIRVLIVDDHAIVRAGLRSLLTDEPGIEVVAEAASAEQALIQTANHLPDVVVLDIQLPDRNGIEVCKEIGQRFAKTRVVMLTSYAKEEFLERSIQAGASGYVLKQVGNEELVRAIRAACQDEMGFDTRTTSQLINRFRQMGKELDENAFVNLSQRERQVMRLIAKGESNKEIGDRLSLSEITIRNYVSNILSKLNLRNRIEIATYALIHHLQDKDE